ncbi:MAG: M56 family metallopeptidase, partial [Cyclobacteriaceae bacterium]
MIHNTLPYLVECLLCSITFLLFYYLVLAKEKSFVFNRIYLLSSMALSFILPLFKISTEAGGAGNMTTVYLPEIVIPNDITSVTATPALNWISIAGTAYLLIAVILLIRLMISLIKVRPQIRQGQIQQERGYTLVCMQEDRPVSTFFRYIFWHNDPELSDSEKELVLQHELTHVKQWHSLDLLLVNLLAAVCWILPVWRYYRNALEETHEYLADREVLRTTDPQQYSRLIARYTLQQAGLNLTHSFANQSIKRITMMKNTLNSIKPMKMLMALPLAGLMFWTVSCEEAEVTTSDTETQKNISVEGDDESVTASNEKEVFAEVDTPPSPDGGMSGFTQHLIDNLQYPTEAKDQDVEGKVFVQFVVNK